MALINCPECSREISDKVKACPHCGYPMVEEQLSSNNIAEISTVSSVSIAERPKSKIPIIVIAGLILITLLCGIIFYTISIVPKNRYTEAIALLEQGKYDQGVAILSTIENYKDSAEIIKEAKYENEFSKAILLLEQGKYADGVLILNTIKEYKNASEILEQVKYESMAYNCINELKKYLKNPDSYSPYEIKFYQMTDSLICIMHYGAQNGFGGNTTGYAMFSYADEKEGYQYAGYTDTLDKDKLNNKDDDYSIQLATTVMINSLENSDFLIGNIDMTRLKIVLKNDAYSTIKIIK